MSPRSRMDGRYPGSAGSTGLVRSNLQGSADALGHEIRDTCSARRSATVRTEPVSLADSSPNTSPALERRGWVAASHAGTPRRRRTSTSPSCWPGRRRPTDSRPSSTGDTGGATRQAVCRDRRPVRPQGRAAWRGDRGGREPALAAGGGSVAPRPREVDGRGQGAAAGGARLRRERWDGIQCLARRGPRRRLRGGRDGAHPGDRIGPRSRRGGLFDGYRVGGETVTPR